jgi:ABC-type transporter MlaC component
MNNPRAVLWHLPIFEVMAAFIDNMLNIDIATPKNVCQQSVNRASTEHQQSVHRVSTDHQQSINRVFTECQQTINRASMISGIASCIIQELYDGIYS